MSQEEQESSSTASTWIFRVAVAGAVILGIRSLFGSSKKRNKIGYQCNLIEDKDFGTIYRSKFISAKEDLVDTLKGEGGYEARTLYESFENSVTHYPNNNFLGTNVKGTYVWKTYKEIGEIRSAIGSGLVQLGLKRQDLVGIYSKNRYEWTTAIQACDAFSLVVVPLYDTLGKDAVKHIINLTEIKAIIVDSSKALNKLLQSLSEIQEEKGSVPLQHIIFLDEEAEEAASQLKEKLSLKTAIHWDELLEIGSQQPKPHDKPKPDDLSTICFTSGTTGPPKGVMLSHKNFISIMGSLKPHGVHLDSSEVYLSYLPLAHVLERGIQTGLIAFAASIGFYSGNIRELSKDIATLRPTFFSGVPRVYNKIYSAVWDKVNRQAFPIRWLFKASYALKRYNLYAFGTKDNFLLDKFVFKSVRERFGGRVGQLITGSAPINGDVIEFLRVALSAEVYEGYGQTECTVACSLTIPGDYSYGHVGAPLPCVDIALRPLSSDEGIGTKENEGDVLPFGEICLRGPSCFSGYYKMDEKTKSTLKEGWLHTGDVGKFTKDGQLQIVGRTKENFKLSQGEYIAPAKIENIYNKSEFINQIFVHGNSQKNFLVAVAVIDASALKSLGASGSFEEQVNNKEVLKAIFEDMEKYAKEYRLSGFEKVRRLICTQEEWTVENKLLTPTMKIKRKQLHQKFEKEIEKIYNEKK